jgi:A/G-specific adenine glycosylase
MVSPRRRGATDFFLAKPSVSGDTPGVPASASRFSPAQLRSLRRGLLAWYRSEARDLPWRRTRDPYAVLVSEFMLQQTQVKTVLPYYDAFLARFPSFAALAAAAEEDVRAAWSGLGYYRRARNLQAASRRILTEHGGRIPADFKALLALPGVGPYTAAALSSILHGLPRAAVDGNVERVLARMTAETRPLTTSAARGSVARLAQEMFDVRFPAEWNQAVMELGATVCAPARPDCPSCPWKRACRARAAGHPERFPRAKPVRPAVSAERAVAVFRRGDAVLLVRRRDASLLDGTWELPGLDLPPGRNARAHLAAHLETWLDRPVRVGTEVGSLRHALTFRRVLLRAFAAEVEPPPRARRNARRWVTRDEVKELPTSSMTTKLLKKLP